jgi:hypothetical protein
MASFFDPSLNAQLRERLERLQPDTPARWGRMNAAQMLRHLDEAFRMALGEVQMPDQSNIFSRLSKDFVIGPMPWMKNLPTAKWLRFASDSVEFRAARQSLLESWDRMLQSPEDHAYGDHPLFGSMSRADYDKLMAKHTEHHLRQFGL